MTSRRDVTESMLKIRNHPQWPYFSYVQVSELLEFSQIYPIIIHYTLTPMKSHEIPLKPIKYRSLSQIFGELAISSSIRSRL